jgi:hypothetical protein
LRVQVLVMVEDLIILMDLVQKDTESVLKHHFNNYKTI